MARTAAHGADGALLTTIPLWEQPLHRFLEGWGELKMVVREDDDTTSLDGPAFTLFEALDFPPCYFPIRIGESAWSRDDLWLQAALLLEGDPWAYVDRYGWKRIRKIQGALIRQGLLDPLYTETVREQPE